MIKKELNRKTDILTDSVIRRMTRLAIDHDAINLSQGFPDFNPPQFIMDRLQEIALAGPHQYSPTWGQIEYRKALAKKLEHWMGIPIDPNENLLATVGSTEAMMASLMALCNPGDKVVIFSPYFENYFAQAVFNSVEPVFVPLIPPKFTFDADVLEAAFKDPKTKAMILCNPSNPSGRVFTKEELQTIADLAIRHDVIIITDEVYEHIIFAPHKHTYIASLPGMWERTVCCSSLSKTYSITGWRLGYIAADKPLLDRCKKVHDFLTVCAPTPLQMAVIPGLEAPDSYYEEFGAQYTRVKDIFTKGLTDIGFRYTEPEGTYFLMVDISDFAKGKSDTEFCEEMTVKLGVAAVPGSSFFNEDVNHLARFHFSKKEETLYEALERLSDIRKKM
ncbi:MAG: aminotransferase class I/II-fold pyridoxal phosphate-dependent enzyme [Clostridia bacterium]|nr:aminotransferase class I/II-fold pyridoxal phosphate-dependent enzyme [Clostridia bacterium]